MIVRRWLVCLPALVGLVGCAAPAPVAPTPVLAGRPPITRKPAPAAIAEFIGVDPERVIASLGQPILRRRDGDAEVWLYEGNADCRVDLVFYRAGDVLKLAHARTRAKVEAVCLQQIAALPPP